MAPSFDIGNPQRSLVRIPGSGQNKTLKPICLDVAQISNFSKSLSEITNFNFSSPPEQALGGTLSISPPLGTASATDDASRQERVHSSSSSNNGSGQKRGPDEELKRNSKRPANDTLISQNQSLDVKQRHEKYKKLESEKIRLESENLELNKKVAMFKDIIRSRNKLKEFLTALHELDAKA